MEEIVLGNTEQCQKHTHFIRNLLDDIIINALDNLEKPSDATKITTCHTNEMSAIVQQFISDDTLIPIPNENHRTSISVSSIDESFQKLELKICGLNKSVNYELALLNKKMDSFSECLNKLVSSSLPSHQEKSLEENISLLKKKLCMKDEIIKKLVETQSAVLNTISANNQHSNTRNQSSSSLPSNSLNDKAISKTITQHKAISFTRTATSTYCTTLFFTTTRYRIPFKHTTEDPSKILH